MASAPTDSELLFGELCSACSIEYERVAEATVQGERRPDFTIRLSGHAVVVEIKQFDPNDDELRAHQALMRGEVVVSGTTPGDRVRKAIQSAAPQLRSLSRGELPAMLVVYNNVLSSRQHTDPYAIATAMNGLDVVPVLVPMDPSISPVFQDVRSGPKRKMTENANTTISAVGVLVRDENGQPFLHAYHNRFARHPISPEWARHARISHWRAPSDLTSSLVPWERA